MYRGLTSNDLYNESTLNRFIDKLKPELNQEGCIEWNGTLSKSGYGLIAIGGKHNKKIFAHRWSVGFINGGEIPPSEVLVLHKCDNPLCVRPSHLFTGSHRDNADDKVNKGRQPTVFGNAKLNWNIVDEIRSSNEQGTILANKFQVSKSTISEIRNNRIWQNELREKAKL